jgi:hypothetical protein
MYKGKIPLVAWRAESVAIGLWMSLAFPIVVGTSKDSLHYIDRGHLQTFLKSDTLNLDKSSK